MYFDTLISDGDFSISDSGLPIQISGVDALIQSAIIRLSIKKGSFIYDPALGSELLSLDLNKIDDFAIFNMVSDALLSMKEISVKKVEKIIDPNKNSIYIKVFICVGQFNTSFDINN